MKRAWLAGAALAVFTGGAALGQDGSGTFRAGQPTADESAPVKEIKIAGLDAVTVYGTRNPTPTLTFPGMADAIGQDEIAVSMPSTISDLVDTMPNVEFGGGPRRTGQSPRIRGLGGEDVLVLIDGVRQSWTSGHDGRFFLDPALLTSVEVVRGPASALYGSGALGGVMAFRTADATDFLDPGATIGGRAVLGYQDVNGEFLRSFTGFAHKDGFDAIASITGRSSDDIRLGSGAELASDDDILTGFAKVGYDSGDGFNVKLSWQGFKNDAVEPANGQGASSGEPIDKTVKLQQYMAELRWAPTPLIDFRVTPYHIDGSVDELDPGAGDLATRDIDTTGVTFDNRSKFDFANVSGIVTIGGEWYHDDQVGTDTATPGGVRSGVPDGEDKFWGVFGQIETKIDNPLGAPGVLTLIPAVRYDSYTASSTGNPEKHEHSVSPKISVTYQPTDWFFIFGNGGKAFRAPGVNELYLSGVHFSVPHPILGPSVAVANTFEPNAALAPETSRFWEAGAGFNFDDLLTEGDALRLKGSYWEQRVDDFIAEVVMTPPAFFTLECFSPPFTVGCNVGTTTSINVDAKLTGAEIEADYDSRRATVELAYGTVDGLQRGTAFELPGLSPNRFIAATTLKAPEIDARIGARVEVASDFSKSYDPTMSDPATEARDGYAVLDFFATWEPGAHLFDGVLRGFRIDMGVDNVTDKNYARTFEGVSEPGRNFKAIASYTRSW